MSYVSGISGDLIRVRPVSIIDLIKFTKHVYDSVGDEQFKDLVISNTFDLILDLHLYENSDYLSYPDKFIALLAIYAASNKEKISLSISGKSVTVNIHDVIKRVSEFKPTVKYVAVSPKRQFEIVTAKDLFFKSADEIYQSMVGDAITDGIRSKVEPSSFISELPASVITEFNKVIETENKSNKDIYIIPPIEDVIPDGFKFNPTNAFEFLKMVWHLDVNPVDLLSIASQLSQFHLGEVLYDVTYKDYEAIALELKRDQGGQTSN